MERGKQDKRKLIIIALLVVIFALIITLVVVLSQDEQTAIIVHDDKELLSNETGKIRISINPSINIENGTMQDIYFSNYNEDRYLKCKIIAGNTTVYESPFVAPGEIIQADVIDKKIKSGQTQATAEIYSYDMAKTQIGQSNVNIVLIN
ncbi:MAG: hypothetical protein KH297_04630 [Firmicutes bacterium]|nr:hypothetical protein [Bacillota bacterium]